MYTLAWALTAISIALAPLRPQNAPVEDTAAMLPPHANVCAALIVWVFFLDLALPPNVVLSSMLAGRSCATHLCRVPVRIRVDLLLS